MSLIPNDAKIIDVDGSTVDFFEYVENDIHYYYFDTSMFGPPEPMLNAMAGLKLIDNINKKLIMCNHTIPNGLLGRIGQNYEHEIEELSDGEFKIIFSYIENESEKADLTQTHCG